MEHTPLVLHEQDWLIMGLSVRMTLELAWDASFQWHMGWVQC